MLLLEAFTCLPGWVRHLCSILHFPLFPHFTDKGTWKLRINLFISNYLTSKIEPSLLNHKIMLLSTAFFLRRQGSVWLNPKVFGAACQKEERSMWAEIVQGILQRCFLDTTLLRTASWVFTSQEHSLLSWSMCYSFYTMGGIMNILLSRAGKGNHRGAFCTCWITVPPKTS